VVHRERSVAFQSDFSPPPGRPSSYLCVIISCTAESRADLPDWLFPPSALVAPPAPTAPASTPSNHTRTLSTARSDAPKRNLLGDVYDAAPSAPTAAPARRPTRAGEGGKATERLRAMRAERVPTRTVGQEQQVAEAEEQRAQVGDRGRRAMVGLPSGPRRI
jgi:hypothetical protein